MFREQESNHLQWPDLALSRHLICIEWINDRVEEIKIQMRTGRTHTEFCGFSSPSFCVYQQNVL